MIVDIFAAREISSKSCEWRAFFSHKKNTTQSMIVGDWKTTSFAWNTFHQWWSHCVFGQKLTIDDCGWKTTRLAWNIFEQWWSKYVFWQRKKYQTIDDCGWLKTCTPCMEYFRLIVIKWCFFCEKEYAVEVHKIFPKKFDRRVLSKKTWWSMIGELLVHLLANSKFKFLLFSTKKVFAFSITNRLVGFVLLVVWLVDCLVGI